MSAAALQPFDGVAGRVRGGAPPGAGTPLSRREARLRSAATTCLAGIALVQTIELPSAIARSATVAALSFAAIALCVGAGLALVAATASASLEAWRAVAAIAVLVLAGWGLPHAVAIPGGAGARGDWAALPGAGCAALAVACLGLTVLAVPLTRAAARGIAAALVILVAFGPGVVALLVAVGPGPSGGETALAADGHVHAHGVAPEPEIVVRQGRNGDHYVTRVSAPPRPPAIGIALAVGAAGVFVYGAVGSLRRRSVPFAAAEQELEGAPA